MQRLRRGMKAEVWEGWPLKPFFTCRCSDCKSGLQMAMQSRDQLNIAGTASHTSAFIRLAEWRNLRGFGGWERVL